MDEQIEDQEVKFLISNLTGDCFNKYEEILERLKKSVTNSLNSSIRSENFSSEININTADREENKSIIQELSINKALKSHFQFENFKIEENYDLNKIKISRVTFFYHKDFNDEIDLYSQKKEITINNYKIKIINNFQNQIHFRVSKSLPEENFEEDFFLYKNKYFLDTKIGNFFFLYSSSGYGHYEKLLIFLNKNVKNGYFIYEPNKEFSFLFNIKKRCFSYEEENIDNLQGYQKFSIGEYRDNKTTFSGNSSKSKNSKLVFYTKNQRDPIIFTNSKGKSEEIKSLKSENFKSFNEPISSIKSPVLHIIQNDYESHVEMLDFKGSIGFVEKIKYFEFFLQEEYPNLWNVKIFPECIFQTDILLINKKDQILNSLNPYLSDHISIIQPRNIVCSKDSIIIGEIKSHFDFHGALYQLEIRLNLLRKFEHLKERPITCFLIFSCKKTALTIFKISLIKEIENKFKSNVYILFYENDFLGSKEDKLVNHLNPILSNCSINLSDSIEVNEKQNLEVLSTIDPDQNDNSISIKEKDNSIIKSPLKKGQTDIKKEEECENYLNKKRSRNDN